MVSSHIWHLNEIGAGLQTVSWVFKAAASTKSSLQLLQLTRLQVTYKIIFNFIVSPNFFKRSLTLFSHTRCSFSSDSVENVLSQPLQTLADIFSLVCTSLFEVLASGVELSLVSTSTEPASPRFLPKTMSEYSGVRKSHIFLCVKHM